MRLLIYFVCLAEAHHIHPCILSHIACRTPVSPNSRFVKGPCPHWCLYPGASFPLHLRNPLQSSMAALKKAGPCMQNVSCHSVLQSATQVPSDNNFAQLSQSDSHDSGCSYVYDAQRNCSRPVPSHGGMSIAAWLVSTGIEPNPGPKGGPPGQRAITISCTNITSLEAHLATALNDQATYSVYQEHTAPIESWANLKQLHRERKRQLILGPLDPNVNRSLGGIAAATHQG